MLNVWPYMTLALVACTVLVATMPTASSALPRAHFLICLQTMTLLVTVINTPLLRPWCGLGAFVCASTCALYVTCRTWQAERAGWIE